MTNAFRIFCLVVFLSPFAHADGQADCGGMEVWDFDVGMCMPLAMSGMSMSMLMIHGNAFGVGTVEEGPRGQNRVSVPNMLMADYGHSVGDANYLGVDLMLTFEKWTFSKQGYPELLQIGEKNEDGAPFIDSQHPHSSPIMGLTFSDRIRFGNGKDNLKLFFAPRGQSTDGPIAFMHRPTGAVNPDAPLGHHIGQDVGHISSTVLGASLDVGKFVLETSAFNGTEPAPTKVDLPLGALNSYAGRVIYKSSDFSAFMASAAYLQNPEPDEPDITWVSRYSASVYNELKLVDAWKLHNAVIYGLVNNLDHVPSLTSFAEEFWFKKSSESYWGRVEYLQRTPGELSIFTAADPSRPRWVSAFTLGYTHMLASSGAAELSAGGSVTKDFLPGEFRDAYSADPFTAKIFVQIGGMKMFDL